MGEPSVGVARLTAVASEVRAAELTQGPGADLVLLADLAAVSEVMSTLAVQVGRLMVALEAAGESPADGIGVAVRSGIPRGQARDLRRAALLCSRSRDLGRLWEAGEVSTEQVVMVDRGIKRAGRSNEGRFLELVVPHLSALDARSTRLVVERTVDLFDQCDPDERERDDHANRYLDWSQYRGGINFQGYLPAGEAHTFMSAITATVEQLRSQGDGVTGTQRRADALLSIIATAIDNGLASTGGLPVGATVTIPFAEARRLAGREPGRAEGPGDRSGPGCTIDEVQVGDAFARLSLCAGQVTPIAVEDPAVEGPGSGGALPLVAGSRPLAVGRAARLATPAQRKALRLRDGACAIPECTGHGAPQPHHVIGWEFGGPTDLDNLVNLCWVHHRHVELGLIRLTPIEEPRPSGGTPHARWWISFHH